MSGVNVADVRGEIKDDPQTLYLMDYPDSDEEIPTLDLSPYTAGEVGARERIAAHLDAISRTVGFFYLNGHGIPQDVIDRVFEESKRFHSLPEETKAVLAAEIADRVLMFDAGKIVEEGTPRQVLKHPSNPRTQQFLWAVLES